MRSKVSLVAWFAMFAAIICATAAAQTETVLHSFNVNGRGFAGPYGGLIFDAAGNLYGTEGNGGLYNEGIVFELTPQPGGGWTKKTLHSFDGLNYKDGAYPLSGVVFDGAGNLYGTTQVGGGYGNGAVYELKLQSNGRWAEKILHSFNTVARDGYQPYAGVVFDAAGNLYGTTSGGGTGLCYSGCGTVFKLSPQADGTWAETLLYSFCSQTNCSTGPHLTAAWFSMPLAICMA